MPVTTGVFKLDLGLDCDGYVSHNVVGTGTRSALAAVYYVIIALGPRGSIIRIIQVVFPSRYWKRSNTTISERIIRSDT